MLKKFVEQKFDKDQIIREKDKQIEERKKFNENIKSDLENNNKLLTNR